MRTDFESFDAFLSFAESVQPIKGEGDCFRDIEDLVEWRGTSTWENAMTLARCGWGPGVALVERERANFENLIGAKVRRSILNHSISGFMPDVGAFCAGEPENMFYRETVDVENPGKIVQVVVSGVASAGISSASIIRRGALICAFVDAVESAGFSVGVSLWNGCTPTRGNGTANLFSVPLKKAGEPLELDRMAFALAHPSMLRRLGFAVWSIDREFLAANKKAGGHFGTPCEAPINEQGDVYFNASHFDNSKNRDIVPWLRAQLAKLGITFED